MSELNEDQIDFLNQAASDFLRRNPDVGSRYWTDHDVSQADLQRHEWLTKTCDFNVSQAAKACRGSRPTLTNKNALKRAQRERNEWEECKQGVLNPPLENDSED